MIGRFFRLEKLVLVSMLFILGYILWASFAPVVSFALIGGSWFQNFYPFWINELVAFFVSKPLFSGLFCGCALAFIYFAVRVRRSK